MRELEPANVRRLLDGVLVAELSRALEVTPSFASLGAGVSMEERLQIAHECMKAFVREQC